MKPDLGRIVIVKGLVSNNSDEHPAIVNAVFGNEEVGPEVWKVNVTVFPDCGPPCCETSINVFDTREDATKYLSEGSKGARAAFWPPKV